MNKSIESSSSSLSPSRLLGGALSGSGGGESLEMWSSTRSGLLLSLK